ncbi:Uncharacterised protein [Cedecea neteri]|uniref:Uncharacterized protein n=1 Tax=Cedecea neteri TaxID=158822 RepID=A0A2X2TB61_9ENTR|nr:Uncharacterised protein [Cedecea neteri]
MSDKNEIIKEATQLINKQLSQEGRRRFFKAGLNARRHRDAYRLRYQ